MMTFEEAIEHCEEVAKITCGECAKEHLQLAEWLRELKGYKEQPKQRWIPVTIDAPTEDGEYLCTFGAETGWFVDWCSWYQGRWVVWTDNTVSEVRNVIAWCKPLEPYKGVTE